MASQGAPYDPYIPNESAAGGAQSGNAAPGNQRTAALQAPASAIDYEGDGQRERCDDERRFRSTKSDTNLTGIPDHTPIEQKGICDGWRIDLAVLKDGFDDLGDAAEWFQNHQTTRSKTATSYGYNGEDDDQGLSGPSRMIRTIERANQIVSSAHRHLLEGYFIGLGISQQPWLLGIAQIDDTVGVMRENINKVSQRGERLDSLQDKTDNLAVSAQGFRRGANRVRKQMWWKDMKMRMCLIIGIIILLIVIIVPAVVATKH